MSRLRRALRRWMPLRTLSSPAAYALWAASYPPTAHNQLMQIEQAGVLALLPSMSGLDILDLGCGSGRYALIATQQKARSVVGLDSSVTMLKRGRDAAALRDSIQADLDAIPYATASFDGVICGLAAGHVPLDRMRSAIHESGRVLRSGGWLVLSDFHPFLFLTGGKRTFTATSGQRFAVEHYPHLMANYFSALTSAGLSLESLSEPSGGSDEDIRPAVLIFRARK